MAADLHPQPQDSNYGYQEESHDIWLCHKCKYPNKLLSGSKCHLFASCKGNIEQCANLKLKQLTDNQYAAALKHWKTRNNMPGSAVGITSGGHLKSAIGINNGGGVVVYYKKGTFYQCRLCN